MSKYMALFPGQGAQNVGMGHDVYSQCDRAKKIFQEVDDALHINLSTIIFDGPSDSLQLTAYTQPALMAVSIAILRVMEERHGSLFGPYFSAAAGHSLGEYTALCASGAISVHDCAIILHERGKAMQQAVPEGEGAMAAILGGDEALIQNILRDVHQNNPHDAILDIANDNAPGQIVISGSHDLVDNAIIIAKDHGLKRAIKLPVSAPFHCQLMQSAKNTMMPLLQQLTIIPPLVPIYANISCLPTQDVDVIRDNLVAQICGRVRWRETMDKVHNDGFNNFVEIGSGKVLSGLVKRCVDGAHSVSINNYDTIMAHNIDEAL